jgi:hypothetical protein
MGERVLGPVRYVVGVGEAGIGVDVEFGVGVQSVSDPPHAHAPHADHARFTSQGGFGGIH